MVWRHAVDVQQGDGALGASTPASNSKDRPGAQARIPGRPGESRPRVGRRRATDAKDTIERLQLGIAGERVLAHQQLAHDAADGPHVHRIVVRL